MNPKYTAGIVEIINKNISFDTQSKYSIQIRSLVENGQDIIVTSRDNFVSGIVINDIALFAVIHNISWFVDVRDGVLRIVIH